MFKATYLGVEVAVKQMNPGKLDKDPRAKELFVREFGNLYRMHHANIITVSPRTPTSNPKAGLRQKPPTPTLNPNPLNRGVPSIVFTLDSTARTPLDVFPVWRPSWYLKATPRLRSSTT